ncbi:type IV secretory system conjugative DNA transfer VirD4/TraG family protein [Microbacterium telephonicum]|uniref:Type IV secretory system conjugative DNA transfer VirD4/TraG family protein n=1 Tax=Microbacterium telephonicum TaxID=1714841 RepID=A0A498CHC3_9MICO|nr:type IV secretory system conjugative DNA transfer VirD4/TraG family protein [Microbacterium telephonicum]
MNEAAIGKAIAIGIAIAVVLSLGLAAVTALVTLIACGSPAEPDMLFSPLWLAFTGDPDTYVPNDACPLPVAAIRIADLVAIVLIVAGVIAAWVWYARYQESDQAFIADLRVRPGFATSAEIRRHLSAKAALRRAPQLRRDMTAPNATDVGWRVGASRGMDVYVSIEDSVALEGPPRSGKGYRVLISAILDWSGPLVTTSTTNDNLTATMRMRQQRGDVYVFDPQGLSGIRDTLRIDLIAGCEDPLIATQRGMAIVTGTALGRSSQNEEWAQAAGIILSRLLHAAAVGGGSVDDLYEWGSSPHAAGTTAVDYLRDSGAPGWAESLQATINGDEKLLSSIWFGVQGAVAPLAVPQVRDSLSPRPGDRVFDPVDFLSGPNTLYLIGSAAGSTAMGGWISALLDNIVEVARTRALASPGSRLPHPLGLTSMRSRTCSDGRTSPAPWPMAAAAASAPSSSSKPSPRLRPRGRVPKRTPSGRPRPRKSSSAARPTSPIFATSKHSSAPATPAGSRSHGPPTAPDTTPPSSTNGSR